MIAVTVGDHSGVETRQIHSESLDVTRKYGRIVARIEEDPTAAVLDQRREAPVFLQRRPRPEGVVQNRDARGLLRFGLEGNHHEEAGHHGKGTHAFLPWKIDVLDSGTAVSRWS